MGNGGKVGNASNRGKWVMEVYNVRTLLIQAKRIS